MKTKFFVMAAMAALFSTAFTACTNNDDDLGGKGAEFAKANGIGFNVHADGINVTRGVATNSGDLKFSDFQTWGYDDEIDYHVTKERSTNEFHQFGTKVTYYGQKGR